VNACEFSSFKSKEYALNGKRKRLCEKERGSNLPKERKIFPNREGRGIFFQARLSAAFHGAGKRRCIPTARPVGVIAITRAARGSGSPSSGFSFFVGASSRAFFTSLFHKNLLVGV
jgi:hypothetical protein